MRRPLVLATWLMTSGLVAACGSDVIIVGTGGGDATTGTHGPPITSSTSASTNGAGGGATECSTDAECVSPTPCVVGHCYGKQCSFEVAGDGTPCEDGFVCTTGDTCIGSTCESGATVVCPPPPGGGACLVAVCDEANAGCTLIPGNEGQPCPTFDACTTNGVCKAGACEGTAIDCSALDDTCVKGACDPMVGGCAAFALPNGSACDDGDPCTANTACSGGVCAGGTAPVVFFSEDFHDNAKNWQLGQEWQIGPATASPVTTPFGPDPATDHSPTMDNGVAGVVIGGNASTAIHPFEYLTSPPFAVTGATAVLRFWRWLNSDYEPWMHDTVDVWNGSAWVNVFSAGGPPGVQDDHWVLQELDLSPYANPAMQIRFGVDVAQTGAFTVSSWNVDDVVVASGFCSVP